MPTNLTLTSSYAGEVLDSMISLMTTGNEAVEQGIVNVESNIIKKLTIPRIQMSSLIQDHAVTPSSAGTYTVDERSLEPQDFMVYLEFNPRDFEQFWRPFQPTGPIVFRELPPSVQIPFLNEVLKKVGNYMGTAVWTGDTGGSAPYDKFDGLKTKALADAAVIDVATPITLNAGNVVAEIARTYDATPAAIRRDSDYKIIVSNATGELYIDAQHNQANKGLDFTSRGPMTYKGVPVVDLNGFPDNTIIATRCGSSLNTSNIHLGIDWNRDSFEEVLQVEKLQANSELHFVKMLMKADTAIGWGEELVLYGT